MFLGGLMQDSGNFMTHLFYVRHGNLHYSHVGFAQECWNSTASVTTILRSACDILVFCLISDTNRSC